jgi:hypothetical protein
MTRADTISDRRPQTILAVAIYNSHTEARTAIKELQDSGFDSEKLSMIDRRSGTCCDRWGHPFTGLYNMGIPQLSVRRYETALQENKFVLFAEWTSMEVGNGIAMISKTHPESVDEHPLSSPETKPDLSAV